MAQGLVGSAAERKMQQDALSKCVLLHFICAWHAALCWKLNLRLQHRLMVDTEVLFFAPDGKSGQDAFFNMFMSCFFYSSGTMAGFYEDFVSFFVCAAAAGGTRTPRKACFVLLALKKQDMETGKTLNCPDLPSGTALTKRKV